MATLNKSEWVCPLPFHFAEVFEDHVHLCCKHWLPNPIGKSETIQSAWVSDAATAIRKSVLDGSYRYCIEKRCPRLQGLHRGDSADFVHQNDLMNHPLIHPEPDLTYIKFNFDPSCNLMCKTCRSSMISNTGEHRVKAQLILENIESTIAPNLQRIDLSGSGDPFYSKTFRNWLVQLDRSKYPKLNHINLHTNGTMWTPGIWSKMKSVESLVTSCELSLDAATETTYQTVRTNGKWKPTLQNVSFIAGLPHVKDVRISFVVQQANYHEIGSFYSLIKNIFASSGKNWIVFFNRVHNWGTFSAEQFEQIDVCDPKHPAYPKVLEQIHQLPQTQRIIHNLT